MSWIEWHCMVEGHEFLTEVRYISDYNTNSLFQVDEAFIKDNFNQVGLKKLFKKYDEALKMIMGDSPEDDDLDKESFAEIYQ